MSPLHVVMAAGGTAGHVAPALNTARALQTINGDITVSVLGTGKELERQLVRAAGYPLVEIPAVAMPRSLNWSAVRAPVHISRAVLRARDYLTSSGANALVGFGGYASAPGYLASRSLGLPFFVHEANSRAGWANRLGARFTPYVGSVHPTGLPHERHMGMPLAPEFSHAPTSDTRAQARDRLGIPRDAHVIVAFGGSQGARRINDAISQVVHAEPHWWVVHAHGAGHDPQLRGERYLPQSYIADMYSAYAAADLVVARAGAMTVAEVAAVGTPTIFVPLAHGNGEQRGNASPLVEAGGALIIADEDLTGDYLHHTLATLMSDATRREHMRSALLACAEPQAAHECALWILQGIREREQAK